MAQQKDDSFPFEFKELDPADNKELLKHFTGVFNNFYRLGPKGYIVPFRYKEAAADIYNMTVKPDDTFIVTYPRSGTTWTQEIIWLIANNLDYDTAAAVPLIQRFPFLEMVTLIDPGMEKKLKEGSKDDEEAAKFLELCSIPIVDLINHLPSPRFIKSHMPLSLLPPTLLDTAKVVFVARDPRDVAVSFYHHNRLFKVHGFVGDFKTYWNFFIRDLIYYSPFFEYNKEGWEKRHHPNMLFLFYEDLIKDLRGVLHRVATFFGKELTEQQIDRLCEHLNIDNFKKNKSVNDEQILTNTSFCNQGEQGMIRKGKVGGWRDYFDEEMMAQAETWIADNLRDTDMRFPQ